MVPQGHLAIPQSYTLGLYQCHQVQPLAPAEQALFVPVSWWEWLIRAGWACSVQSRCGANLPWLSQLTLSENQNQQREYDNNVLQGPCFSLCLVSCWWHNSEFITKNGAQALWCVSTWVQIHPMHELLLLHWIIPAKFPVATVKRGRQGISHTPFVNLKNVSQGASGCSSTHLSKSGGQSDWYKVDLSELTSQKNRMSFFTTLFNSGLLTRSREPTTTLMVGFFPVLTWPDVICGCVQGQGCEKAPRPFPDAASAHKFPEVI